MTDMRGRLHRTPLERCHLILLAASAVPAPLLAKRYVAASEDGSYTINVCGVAAVRYTKQRPPTLRFVAMGVMPEVRIFQYHISSSYRRIMLDLHCGPFTFPYKLKTY